MRHLAFVSRDGSVDLATCPDGAYLHVPGSVQQLELTEQQWSELHEKVVTHDIKFDKVKKRLVAIPRANKETKP